MLYSVVAIHFIAQMPQPGQPAEAACSFLYDDRPEQFRRARPRGCRPARTALQSATIGNMHQRRRLSIQLVIDPTQLAAGCIARG